MIDYPGDPQAFLDDLEARIRDTRADLLTVEAEWEQVRLARRQIEYRRSDLTRLLELYKSYAILDAEAAR